MVGGKATSGWLGAFRLRVAARALGTDRVLRRRGRLLASREHHPASAHRTGNREHRPEHAGAPVARDLGVDEQRRTADGACLRRLLEATRGTRLVRLANLAELLLRELDR